MYLLDTNVVAELRKAKSRRVDQNVLAWANRVSPGSLFLSVITVLELEVGTLSSMRWEGPRRGALSH